jgi:hypothetical protein|tara:strand:- start:1702 stop:2664 length:963 start_codon:yes stop_codon:yes gene_type:complete
MIKKLPIKKPYVFDTPEGVDHVTKTLEEDNIEKLTPLKKEVLNKLNREMKLSLLKSEEQSLKKFENDNPKSYPSDPEQRGKLMNIQALEKSLGIRPDSWRRYAKTGVLPLGKKEPNLWTDVLYPSMTIREKAQWNALERKKGFDGRTGKELPKKREEFEKEKKQNLAFSHLKQQWGLNKKENDGVKYVGSREHLYDDKKKVASVPNKPTEANGHDPNPNVIPIGPIPHEKPWYEDLKELKAESNEAEERFKMVLVEGALDKLEDSGIETIYPERIVAGSKPLNLDQILDISRNIGRIHPKDKSIIKSRLMASIPKIKMRI